MRDFLRNLRLPGRRPSPVRRNPYSSRAGARTATRGRSTPRQFSLGRVERTEPPRRIQVPWKRIGVTVSSVAMVGAIVYGATWLVTGDTLRVLEIDVAGAQIEDPLGIAFAANVGGESMLRMDLDEAARAVTALPGIRSATVTRDWPQRVRIEVVEHQAWGYWQVGNQPLVIDVDGRVLERSRPAPADAPVIIELAAPRDTSADARVDADTVRLVARLVDDPMFRRMGVEPNAFVFRQDRGLTVLVENGPDAIFGDSSNYEFKLQAWRGLVQQFSENDIEAREVDLRFGRNVVLR
jgi:cell division protein FtsQ